VFGGYLNLLIIAGSGVLNISESENYLFAFCGGKSEYKNCQFGYFKYPKELAMKESVKELVVIKAVICFFSNF
jgi:hypothetical protein